MSICFCMETGEKLLNLIALGVVRIEGRCGVEALDECGANPGEVALAKAQLNLGDEHAHVLVTKKGRRTNRKNVHGHLWSGVVPPNSVIRICEGVYVASPEFNALLMMRGLSWLHTPQVLMRYCGLFAIDESVEEGFRKRPPLTSTHRLREFANGLRGEVSVKALLQALDLTIDRARSPMEACLVLPLIAPRMRGGFGFVHPEFNASVHLSEAGRSIWGFDSIEGDLVWRQFLLILEYNGRFRHEERFGTDLTRLNALEASDYQVRMVTYQQLRSARQMLVIGSWLAEGLGVSKDLLPERELLQGILTEVLSFKHPHISLGDVLP